jgi:glycosyl hydrolase family 46
MSYTEAAKRKAMAIVRIFETGKATGDYAAVAVLNDGAGISYGTNQFTHRSGSLLRVVEEYLASGSNIGRPALTAGLADLKMPSAAAIKRLSANPVFKNALRAAAATGEMRKAQDETAEQLYLAPAIAACGAMNFTLPLSLSVVYDSITHGSWERIRDLTPRPAGETPEERERAWITAYVRKRDAWLASVKRLAATRYRTRFFLNQIAVSNWELKLPLRVQGVRLTDDLIESSAVEPENPTANPGTEANGPFKQNTSDPATKCPECGASATDPQRQAQPPDRGFEQCLDRAEQRINSVTEKFDRIEAMIESVTFRADSAKSLWTTVWGIVTQAAWALFGLVAGVPREVWLAVAVIAAALMLAYLYRQTVLGKIREMKS